MTVNDHAETAIDQLRLADDVGQRVVDPAQAVRFFLDAAKVHALLAIAEAIRETTHAGWADLPDLNVSPDV